MWNRGAVVRSGIIATLGCAVCSTHLLAQTKTLNRIYDPVVVAAGKLAPLSNASIASLTAYRYDTSSGEFFPIPLQIDEVDPSGNFLRENDGIADSNDVIVFMPGDTGDRAPADKWLNDSGALQKTRIELEASDPLAPAGKGWVYLFRDVSLPPTVTPYVRYHRGPSTSAGSDTVKGVRYIAGHGSNGWANYLALAHGGGSAKDLIDQQKARVKGVAKLGIFTLPYETNENNGLGYVDVRFAGGPVRGFRELKVVLSAVSGATAIPIDTVSFVTQYLPYSTSLGAKEAKIDSAIADLAGVNLIRQSIDFSQNAAGMKFFNAYNRSGFIIDGVPDAPDATITTSPDVNWLMVTGTPATVLLLLDVPAIGNSRTLYYRDDTSAGPLPDNTTDTGDMKSYGDVGVMITGSSIRGRFSFDLTTYYLDPNQPVGTGDTFRELYLNPLQVTALEQTRTATAVSDSRARPAGFALDEARPNPFWPLRGRVLLGFNSASAAAAPSLRVFNLLGQEVMRFDLSSSSAGGNSSWQQVLWDGRNADGQLLPAGIYFLQLQAGAQVATKKLVILR